MDAEHLLLCGVLCCGLAFRFKILYTKNILKETGISDHLTCLLRNLYAGQEVIEADMEQ